MHDATTTENLHASTLKLRFRHCSAEAKAAGITHFERAPSLNDEPLLTSAMAEIVAAHLRSGRAVDSPQYQLNCSGCTNPACRSIVNPAGAYDKLRDTQAACKVPAWPTHEDITALRARGDAPCN